MSLFIAKRLLTLVLTLVFTSVIVFVVMEILPGDPALLILGIDAPPEAVVSLRSQLGLDRPPVERYLAWLGGIASGEFGQSYTYQVPVWDLIGDRLAITLPLTLFAMVMAILASLAMGIYAAARHNRAGDLAVMTISQIGISIPNFWLGILLISAFAVGLGWFGAGGFPGWGAGIGPALKALLLPAISLAVVQAAILARVTRSAMLEVMREDFVRTARAKGLSRRAVLWRHVVRNALIPVITITGLQFGFLLTGAIVVEQVFNLPGLGRLVFSAISDRDVEVVKNCVMLVAFLVIAINFAVDMLYAAIDPRLKAADA